MLFETTKIQIYETNLQLSAGGGDPFNCCLRLQRYKFMKPIYSLSAQAIHFCVAVWDYKDTNLWNQFTALKLDKKKGAELFETTKIQIYETNLQPIGVV